MYVIGITGGIGAGKSTVTSYVREKGYPILDADQISREITEDPAVLRQLSDTFGASVLRADGSLDREKMAGIVFHDREKRCTLENIVTRGTIEKLEEEICSRKDDPGIIFLDGPILFETGAEYLTDAVWLVTCSMPERYRRLALRSGMTREQVDMRIASQMPEEEKAKKSDDIIDNSGTREETITQVELLLKKYSEKS